ncbi:MAG: hypothetical protein AABY22_09590 [Nanoarchaeota archaeon]
MPLKETIIWLSTGIFNDVEVFPISIDQKADSCEIVLIDTEDLNFSAPYSFYWENGGFITDSSPEISTQKESRIKKKIFKFNKINCTKGKQTRRVVLKVRDFKVIKIEAYV